MPKLPDMFPEKCCATCEWWDSDIDEIDDGVKCRNRAALAYRMTTGACGYCDGWRKHEPQ